MRSKVTLPFGLSRFVLYEPMLVLVFALGLPWFFTICRYVLSIVQGVPNPYMPGLEFTYPYLPGAPMPVGRFLFILGIVLIVQVTTFLRLPKDAIQNFQEMSVPAFILFWISHYALMGMFWLQIPVW